VLTHFEDFNLFPLLIDLDRLHLLFANNFNSRLGSIFKVVTKLHLTELALAQSLVKLVKI
jgi:hypothetical protein